MAKFPKTLLLVSSVKIQYARDDEGPHSCINQNKNIDNDLYCSSNEQLGILSSLSKIARAHFLNLIFFLRTMKTSILRFLHGK